MGFFRKLFGGDEAAQAALVAAPIQPARTAAVGYDPDLMETLLGHHAQLGALFERIGRSAKAGDYAKVRTLLVRFKTSLQGHILTENVRFYAYLEKMLAKDPENSRIIHEFRREMNTIARQVTEFVSAWQESDFASAEQRAQFLVQYREVGKLLEQRLDNEEGKLYPLYR